MMSTPILATSHYGVVRFGDLAVEAVVLEDGTRGYVQRQLATAIGLHESRRGSQLKTLLSDVAPVRQKSCRKTPAASAYLRGKPRRSFRPG